METKDNVRATDRAREVIQMRDGAWMTETEIQARSIALPALDFADAVEAALSSDEPASVRANRVEHALDDFLAQLDRATGGGA